MNKRHSIRFLLALALLTLLGSWGLVQAAPVAAGITPTPTPTVTPTPTATPTATPVPPTEEPSPPPPPPSPTPTEEPLLPETGSTSSIWLLASGVGALALGCAACAALWPRRQRPTLH